ncbi:MAG: putative LPLAT superfamily acyltransferase [Polaribacter sp.]|jgi:predicted LPLAT superfamily acyltransferase
MSENEQKQALHWSNFKEVGTLLGLRFLKSVHSLFGRRMVSIMLYPTVAYFLIFRSLTRNSSAAYLDAHFKTFPSLWKKPPSLRNVAHHFHEFAETVVDKLLSWLVTIDEKQFNLRDAQYVEKLMEDPRGQLIIGSHFGNLEYCRGFVHRYRSKVINILVHDQHSQNYNTLMQQLNPESRLNIIQVAQFDIPTMLKLKARIDQGEWVFIAGDRSPLSGSKRSVSVSFLGKSAELPIGPYLLAKALACPVHLMFTCCDYQSDKLEIRVDVINFADPMVLERKNRDQQLQAYAQRYADELAKQCALSPYQWFNFYDFWAPQEPSPVDQTVKAHG